MGRIITETAVEEWGWWVRVNYDEGKKFFSGFDKGAVRRRADLFETLWTELGGFEVIETRGRLPINVACAGQAAIAAYLFSVHTMSSSEIAETMDVSESTVEQYLADVRNGRRL